MRPYYQRDGITIYHGDAREILPELPRADLLLSDPPYGMDYKPLRGGTGSKRWRHGIHGDAEPFDPAFLLGFDRVILFGANWYADKLPPSGGWIVWDKTPDGVRAGWSGGHAELAWCSWGGRTLKYSLEWGGPERGREPLYHPTQKPVALMSYCLQHGGGESVCDPFMGAGATLRAAADIGRPAVGIEIDERYCEIAANRMAQKVFAF